MTRLSFLAMAFAIFTASISVKIAEAKVLSTSSPSVEQGKMSLDLGSSIEGDKLDDDTYREYTATLYYGLTPYWKTGIKSTIGDDDSGTTYRATSFRNLFRLYKQSEGVPATLAIRFQYDRSHVDSTPNKIQTRFIASREDGALTTLLNLAVKKEIGGGAESGLSAETRANITYDWTKYFGTGVEYIGDMGNITDAPGFSAQDHRIGPVFSGSLTDMTSYEFGYLAGISDHAPKHSLKVNLSFKFN